MTESSSTWWTCDRCKQSTECSLGKQPDGWSSVRLASPPNHAEPERLADLCVPCGRDLKRFLVEAPATVGQVA